MPLASPLAKPKRTSKPKQNSQPKSKSKSKSSTKVEPVVTLGATSLSQGYTISRLALSPDGSLIATADREGKVRLIEAATGRCLHELARPFPIKGPKSPFVEWLSFSANGEVLVAYYRSLEGMVVYEVSTGERRRVYQLGSWSETWSAISPDGRWLAGTLHGIELMDLESTSDSVSIRVGADREVTHDGALTFSPDSKHVAAVFHPRVGPRGAGSYRVRVFDVARRKQVEVLEVKEDLCNPTLAWLPDGRRVVYSDGMVLTWAPGARKYKRQEWVVAEEEQYLLRPLPSLGAIALRSENEPQIYDQRSKQSQPFPPTSLIAAAADGKHLVTAEGAALRLWDWDSGKLMERSAAPLLRHEVSSIAFTPDGEQVATGDQSGLHTWQVSDGRHLKANDCGWIRDFTPDARLALVQVEQDAKAKRAVQLAERAGKPIPEEMANVVEIASGKRVGQLPVLSTFSLDGTLGITSLKGKDTKRVWLWSASTGEEVREFDKHHCFISGVALSPDKSMVASCDEHGRIAIYDVADGKLRLHFQIPKSIAFQLCFSPDGKLLAAGREKALFVFSLSTGKQLHQLRIRGRHSNYALAFSPDGRLLAAGDALSLRVWDVERGELLGLHRVQVCSLAFSPDNKLLAVGSNGSAPILEVSALSAK